MTPKHRVRRHRIYSNVDRYWLYGVVLCVDRQILQWYWFLRTTKSCFAFAFRRLDTVGNVRVTYDFRETFDGGSSFYISFLFTNYHLIVTPSPLPPCNRSVSVLIRNPMFLHPPGIIFVHVSLPQMSEDIMSQCHFSYMDESVPISLEELGAEMGYDWRGYLNVCTSALLKEVNNKWGLIILLLNPYLVKDFIFGP